MSHRPIYTNRLAKEKSPYLLQHAHNPVDWYPWSEEAFSSAIAQDKPIFLSIGYATCHWCHVMEQESFQDVEIAQLMNEAFINVKVDREEMPEIDALYMELAQAIMAGGAGWPLNLVLTPEKEPFFAATYLPADASHGFLGMKQLILRIKQIWEEPQERELVMMQAGRIVDIFAGQDVEPSKQLPQEQQLLDAEDLLFKTADPIYGGTRGAPKFPAGFQVCFLLRRCRMSADSRALFYVERTLKMMYRGGIYDHLGGGFSRYSIDEQWMIPHFEKMLYDNAILAHVYLETWQYTHDLFYKTVTKQILDYIVREMQGEAGGFVSAQDADSLGEEGAFYTWTWQELQQALQDDASLFCEYFGATPTGNFKGRNILHIPLSIEEFAARRRLDPQELSNVLNQLTKQLWQVRLQRPQPLKDDKIITSYNGLAIYTLAEAGLVLNEPTYLQAAEQAADFVIQYLWQGEELKRRWREQEAKFSGALDDYAFIIQGLISLFEADRGVKWLEFAFNLVDILETDFKADSGAYYYTNGKDPNLLLRRCEFYDGAEPAGNGVHAENCLRLYQLTGQKEYRDRAEAILLAAKEHVDLYPPGACCHLLCLQRYYDNQAPTIVIALNAKEDHKADIVALLSRFYIPHKAVIWKRESDEELRDLLPIVRGKEPVDQKTAIYICYTDRCLEPIIDLAQMEQTLSKL